MMLKLVTLDPAHFHAALVQKAMVAGVGPHVRIYAPLGSDLLAHLQRIHGFNSRTQDPTSWTLDIHAGDDFFERFLAEKSGDVVVLSGRNRRKIEYLERAVAAGFHVLADKPWILVPEDLPRLAAVLEQAEARGRIVYDVMTERFEITNLLQRELMRDAEVFGPLQPGTPTEPGIVMTSVHSLMKKVAGVPLRRPAWFFDPTQQGEGLTDVGTHLVDLAFWLGYPEQALEYQRDVTFLSATRWPTLVSAAEFATITGEATFPAFLQDDVREGSLHYHCNNAVIWKLRDTHVRLDILWDVRAGAGTGDTHFARCRGERSILEIRQGKKEKYRPELYIRPHSRNQDLAAALTDWQHRLQGSYPGIGIEESGREYRVTIPERYRVGHEAHFAQVTQDFLAYVRGERRLPTWEKPNLLAKYHLTTTGVARGQPIPPP